MSASAAPENGDSPYHSRAISRALDVLEAFDEEHVSMNLKDLTRLLGVSDSSLFRVLVTLQHRGYLLQNEDGCYQLAPRVLLGKLSERAEAFRTLARPELQKLAARLNETASLAYLFADRIQVIDSIDSLHEIRVTNRAGRVLPPHCSSLGKAITAFQTSEHIGRILECYGMVARTPHSISDRNSFVEHLARVRASGIAYDREESMLGGICVAAAVQHGGKVLAAVSVSTPVARMTPRREKETAGEVLAAAAALAKLL
jgi:DNA-binding IclR family transcriptional regulator